MTDEMRTALTNEIRDVLIDQCVCFNDPLPQMLTSAVIARMLSDEAVERAARRMYFEHVDRHGYPNGFLTWDEMAELPERAIGIDRQHWRDLVRAAITDAMGDGRSMMAKRNEAASMWRNGVTNTAIIVDRVRKKHERAGRRSKAFADFSADLDRELQAWFEDTRANNPQSYDQAEHVFVRHTVKRALT